MFPLTTSFLIVDDSKMTRDIITKHLKQIGFTQIRTAENGIEAMNILREQASDVVFMDWNMPLQSGIETLLEIKVTPELQHIDCILVTSESNKNSLISAYTSGAAHLIPKPFEFEDIKKGLELVFARKVK